VVVVEVVAAGVVAVVAGTSVVVVDRSVAAGVLGCWATSALDPSGPGPWTAAPSRSRPTTRAMIRPRVHHAISVTRIAAHRRRARVC
jgi:hypothetical protein